MGLMPASSRKTRRVPVSTPLLQALLQALAASSRRFGQWARSPWRHRGRRLEAGSDPGIYLMAGVPYSYVGNGRPNYPRERVNLL